jgi:hypothetical protein
MKISNETILSESKKFISELKNAVPEKLVDEWHSRHPFKIKSVTYILVRRIIDLAENAIFLFESERYLASIIVVRSISETGSLLYWFNNKINKLISEKQFDELDVYLMKILFGSKSIESEKEPIEPYNVLKYIDAVDKEVKGYRHNYDILCDYTHPNYTGSMNIFSKLDTEEGVLYLGSKTDKVVLEILLAALGSTLGLSLSAVKDINNNFDEICKILN